MSETSGPFNSVSGDRVYSAAQSASFWSIGATQDGVILGRLNSLTPANAGTLALTMDTGYASMGGVGYFNSASLSFALNTVASGYQRIDRLVVRFDATTTRSAFAYVIQGVAQTVSPSVPSIGANDIPIARILIDNSTGSYVYTMTDERQVLTVATPSTMVNGRFLGEIIPTEIALTPGVNCPVINRNIDRDITASGGSAGTNAPLLVKAYRNFAPSTIINGVTQGPSYSVTVTGSSVVFGPTGDGLLSAVYQEALVAGFLNGNQAATYSADFTTAATQLCINVAGIDYSITNVMTGSRTVSVSGTPASGTQTAIFYPFRIAGNANAIRLRRLSGFIPAAQGDFDGTITAGLRIMDTLQYHLHTTATVGSSTTISGAYADAWLGNIPSSSPITFTSGTPITDGSHGTPRLAKNTSPRSFGTNVYSWAGVLA